MAETVWNLTAPLQTVCKLQNVSIEEIPREQLRIKESLGRGCLGEVNGKITVKICSRRRSRVLHDNGWRASSDGLTTAFLDCLYD